MDSKVLVQDDEFHRKTKIVAERTDRQVSFASSSPSFGLRSLSLQGRCSGELKDESERRSLPNILVHIRDQLIRELTLVEVASMLDGKAVKDRSEHQGKRVLCKMLSRAHPEQSCQRTCVNSSRMHLPRPESEKYLWRRDIRVDLPIQEEPVGVKRLRIARVESGVAKYGPSPSNQRFKLMNDMN